MSLLADSGIRASLFSAWQESSPGTAAAHEEGGFILRQADGSLTVERWSRGGQDRIVVPPHPDGQRHGATIVATFHTHPNPGTDFLQEPSPTDILAVKNDPDLGHSEYEGEFVISTESIYLIKRSGAVLIVGPTAQTL